MSLSGAVLPALRAGPFYNDGQSMLISSARDAPPG